MRVALWRVAAVAVIAVGGLAACGSDPGTGTMPTPTAGPVTALGEAPPTSAPPKPAATKTTTKPPPIAAPLTCDTLKNAKVGSAAKKYNGYADYIPLLDGVWAGEDGNTVTLKICGIGDLTGDGSLDGMAALVLDGGGTGKFWSLVVWKNVAGKPVYYALLDLDDRTPVQSIDIAGQRATVEYLTRGPSDPAAAVTIRRTTIFKLTGSKLVEVSHMDVPYTP